MVPYPQPTQDPLKTSLAWWRQNLWIPAGAIGMMALTFCNIHYPTFEKIFDPSMKALMWIAAALYVLSLTRKEGAAKGWTVAAFCFYHAIPHLEKAYDIYWSL